MRLSDGTGPLLESVSTTPVLDAGQAQAQAAKVVSYDTPRGAIGGVGRCTLRRGTPHECRPSSTTEIGTRDSPLVASGGID